MVHWFSLRFISFSIFVVSAHSEQAAALAVKDFHKIEYAAKLSDTIVADSLSKRMYR